jgi:hypothetical protein
MKRISPAGWTIAAFGLCACRKPHPCTHEGRACQWAGWFTGEVRRLPQARDLSRVERFGDGAQGRRLIHHLVGPVGVVVLLELVEGMAQMALVPEEGAAEEFVAAGLDPALHDGVHAWHPDAGEDDLDAGVCQELVEERGELRVPISDQVSDGGLGVFQVHDEVSGGLGDPVGGGVRGGAEDPDAASGVLNDGQAVLALVGQGDGFDEVAGQEGVGLGVQEVGPGGGTAVGRGVEALGLEYLPDAGRGDLDAEGGEFAVHPAVAPGWAL